VIIRVRSRLCATNGALDVGAANAELIPVLGEWLEVDGFDLCIRQQDGQRGLDQ